MRWKFGLSLLWLCLCLAYAQGVPPPFYAASSIVNAANQRAEALAPNTIATIYGTNLSYVTKGLTAEDLRGGILPTALLGTGVRILVDRIPANIYFVSPGQVNFLVPGLVAAESATVQLGLDSRFGPAIRVRLADYSPALFQLDPEFVVATRPDGSVVTRDTPARPGEIIILYATGLGLTRPRVPAGQIPATAAVLDKLSQFRVEIGARLLDSTAVLYAGVAPGFAGLYQINLIMPQGIGKNPEIRIGYEGMMSPREVALLAEELSTSGNQ